MVLPCRLAEEVAHLQERARIRLERVLVGVLVGKQQQFVEQAAVVMHSLSRAWSEGSRNSILSTRSCE